MGGVTNVALFFMGRRVGSLLNEISIEVETKPW